MWHWKVILISVVSVFWLSKKPKFRTMALVPEGMNVKMMAQVQGLVLQDHGYCSPHVLHKQLCLSQDTRQRGVWCCTSGRAVPVHPLGSFEQDPCSQTLDFRPAAFLQAPQIPPIPSLRAVMRWESAVVSGKYRLDTGNEHAELYHHSHH